MYELRDSGLDGLVGRQFRFGVEFELPFGPGQRADDCVVAGLPIPLRVKKVAEKEIQGGRLTVAISKRKGTCRPLALGGFQQRAKRNFGERAV
jgi:hypothetical protein